MPADGPEIPGRYPFTRGVYPEMYRTRLWTMRQFAGFGTAAETNRRFRDLLAKGGGGLSVAFDLPTLMGRDSDDQRSLGEVGRCGVAVDVLDDVVELFAGIDLGETSVSMTINSPAAILLAMFVVVGEAQGVPRERLAGTLQNDILKEYQAQKEFIFPPTHSMRLVADVVQFASARMPKFHPISVSGYHIREAGSTAAQEVAFTLANGLAYLELAQRRGVSPSVAAEGFSFFFNAQIDLFEEVAKYRAARRLWARQVSARFSPVSQKAIQMRFHTQTSGASLSAQQPELNIARTAIEALAGVLGGTQSLHTNSMDEVLSLPTDKAARIALRTQQVIAYETGVTEVPDPLGGSYYVEELTDRIEAEACELIDEIESMGGGSVLNGVLAGIEEGWFQRSIADSAYAYERLLASGERKVVSVNAFTEGNEEDHIETLAISLEPEREQVRRLATVRAARNGNNVDAALSKLQVLAADPLANLMEPIIEAVSVRATVGEVISALESVWGDWPDENSV